MCIWSLLTCPCVLSLASVLFYLFGTLTRKVGIKATNIGSLIRQAPWLVIQRIDGQMLPVAMFLRRAGVTDMERVVRAYPRILCSSIRGDLAPRVRLAGVAVEG